jgi:hypothetical protein
MQDSVRGHSGSSHSGNRRTGLKNESYLTALPKMGKAADISEPSVIEQSSLSRVGVLRQGCPGAWEEDDMQDAGLGYEFCMEDSGK